LNFRTRWDSPRVKLWYRPIVAGLSLGLLLTAVVELWWGITLYHWGDHPGIDLDIYLEATRRVLAGQPWHLARQLAGPTEVQMGDVLYPVTSVILFAPWLVAPRVLWWAIPVGITAALIVAWRPRAWTWLIIAACLAWPLTMAKTITGNPSLWMMALLAVGLMLDWPTAFILLKPSLFPFALLGLGSKVWWVIVAALALGSALFLLDDLADYPTVLLNSRNSLGVFYSLVDVPMLIIPGVAWLNRTQDPKIAGLHPAPTRSVASPRP
jgi:hypothetical protein